MPDLADVFAVIATPPGGAEPVLRQLVAPLARELRHDPRLDTLFYGRFSHPREEVRFRVQGEPGWIRGPVADRLRGGLRELEISGAALDHDLGRYAREVDRFGGELGMRATERIYHHDSLACLDLIDLDGRGLLGRSRREIAVAFTERVLDALGLTGPGRLAFYTFAARWPAPDGDWGPGDMASLDARYSEVAAGLALLATEPDPGPRDPIAVWGNAETAGVADAALAALAPVLGEARIAQADGAIRQDLVYLAWSWTHMHCNRLGLSALQEAILRQLVLRHFRRATGS